MQWKDISSGLILFPEDFIDPSKPCSVQLDPNTPENKKKKNNKQLQQNKCWVASSSNSAGTFACTLFYPGTDTVDGGIAQLGGTRPN